MVLYMDQIMTTLKSKSLLQQTVFSWRKRVYKKEVNIIIYTTITMIVIEMLVIYGLYI